LDGFGGEVRRVLWNLNVYTFNATQTCDQIRYIAGLPGQQEPGVLLELGNELAQSGQGLPRFPNGAAYAQAMVPVVACARKYMPHAVRSDLRWHLRACLHGTERSCSALLRRRSERVEAMANGMMHCGRISIGARRCLMV
jgi:hypothetical protein